MKPVTLKQALGLCLAPLLVFVLVAMPAVIGKLRAQPVNPVLVTWIDPAPGSTVSNTVALNVMAGSSAGPIARVEFYDVFSNSVTHLVTTNLISIVTNRPPDPRNFIIY